MKTGQIGTLALRVFLSGHAITALPTRLVQNSHESRVRTLGALLHSSKVNQSGVANQISGTYNTLEVWRVEESEEQDKQAQKENTVANRTCDVGAQRAVGVEG